MEIHNELHFDQTKTERSENETVEDAQGNSGLCLLSHKPSLSYGLNCHRC